MNFINCSIPVKFARDYAERNVYMERLDFVKCRIRLYFPVLWRISARNRQLPDAAVPGQFFYHLAMPPVFFAKITRSATNELAILFLFLI